MTKPTFFPTPGEFRKWLVRNHGKTDELWLGYYKKTTGIPGITWPESVDEALCYGWIDGIRKSIDDKSYQIRFTPRKVGSNWSERNIERVKELKKQGKMEEPGLNAFEGRKKDSASDPRNPANIDLPDQYKDKLRSNKKAWDYFNTLAPSFQRLSIGWIMDAKKEETRFRRLGVLIESSENGRKVPPLIVGRKRN